MKSLKLLLLALSSVALCSGLAQAAAAQPDANAVATIQAALVVGTGVHKTNPDGTDGGNLKRGDYFKEGTTIATDASSSALLVFSNGAAIRVKPSTSITVKMFEQASYDQATNGTYLRLTKDPSKSNTEIDIAKGDLAGEVKTLDTGAGSTFNVVTPAGSAGIRGTIFTVNVTLDANGNVTGVSVTCAEGVVTFSPSAYAKLVAQVKATVNTQQAAINAGGAVNVAITIDSTTGLASAQTSAGTAVPITGSTQTISDIVGTVNDAITAQNTAAAAAAVNAGTTAPAAIPLLTTPPPPPPNPPSAQGVLTTTGGTTSVVAPPTTPSDISP